jgi:hypothetical protein
MPYDNPLLLPAITPVAGLVTTIVVGGTAAIVFPAGIYGGYIVNPIFDADQNVSAEALYVDPVGSCPLNGYGSVSRIEPGGVWTVPAPNSSLPVRVNAATSGHRFTAVYWM